MEYRIYSLDEQTWRIEEFDRENSVYMYLLAGEREAALIDAGFGTVDLQAVAGKLTSLPLRLLLTHAHFDHIGGAASFEEAYLHPADLPTYETHSSAKMRTLFPQITFPEGRPKLLPLEDGEIMDLGGRTLEIIHTPGHSEGSVCVLDRERRQLFTGDTCCKADVLLNIEYSTTVETYLHTIRKLQRRRSAYDLTWPAHHQTPVSTDILDQFAQAAELLCKGEKSGLPIDTVFGPCCRLAFGDIGIVYLPQRI